ncbi:MAG: 2-(1,2-epoxy-1,2-dihydrophenyl)acetyl-CoA isomerase [Burkholderiales bacterium PBB4]|nr:MAG: 2-(1,2-epoxy-1,2-dihydrophenyl)acetyl-CoA isomerase [Burkholderiales bacterium PBB4]
MTDTALPHFDTLRLHLDGSVAVLTLNRPQRLNAAPPQMFAELHRALGQLPALGARALLITGEGRAFCSGADLQGGLADAATSSTGAAPSRGDQAYQALSTAYSPALLALANLPMPVVTAVNGVAAGIGCSLALAADFTIAARSAYFLEAFVNIGLVPDGGATWMLARQVGKARATQMLMLGERIPAEQADQWGLIYRAVDDAALPDEALALARRLAAGPTRTLSLIRQGLARALEQGYAQSLQMEAEHQRIAANTPDAVEGATAFLQRRPAVFGGR